MDTPQHQEVRSDDLRRNLRPLLNAVEREHAHVTIKRYDEAVAVLVPVGWYATALHEYRERHEVTPAAKRRSDARICIHCDASLVADEQGRWVRAEEPERGRAICRQGDGTWQAHLTGDLEEGTAAWLIAKLYRVPPRAQVGALLPELMKDAQNVRHA